MLERNIHTYTIREQLALHKANAVILGCGGGGCTMAETLTRSGVGKITLVDFDKFEDSNKNRQLGALNSTMGKFKTLTMAERIKDINPRCIVQAYTDSINKDNYKMILSDKNIILDAVDKRSNKEMVGGFVRDLGLVYTTGGLGGYNFWCATLKNKRVNEILKNDNGVPFYPCASAVIMQGALQAQQAINYYLGREQMSLDKAIHVNLMNLAMSVEDIN